MNHVRELISVILLVIILIVSVYGLCLTIKVYCYEEEKEIYPAEDNNLSVDVEFIVPENEINLQPNASKLIRSLIVPSFPGDKIKITELSVSENGEIEFEMLLDLNIEWHEEEEEAYDKLKLNIAYAIEDLYDKEFNLEKSISTNVDRIEKLQNKIFVIMRAEPMGNQELKPEELRNVIENGSVKLLEELIRESFRKETQESDEDNDYDNDETTESFDESELYLF